MRSPCHPALGSHHGRRLLLTLTSRILKAEAPGSPEAGDPPPDIRLEQYGLICSSPPNYMAGGEGDDRGWDAWMASLTRWTWVSVNSGSWWWTGRPGMLRFMGLQSIRHDWATDLIRYFNKFNVLIVSLMFAPYTTKSSCKLRINDSIQSFLTFRRKSPTHNVGFKSGSRK